MISTRLLRPLAVAAFAAGLLAASPASAHPAAGQVVGTGTISPGLPTMGCANQSVSFDGTGAVVGNHVGAKNIHFEGNSNICETLQAGSGCGVLSGDVNGSVCYSRTGNVVTVTGSATVDGGPHDVSATCVFSASSAHPVESFGLTCTVSI